MKDYKKLNLPSLTTQDEEYQMLIDVADLFTKQEAITNEKKSGDATEITVRNHLLLHGLRMALNPELTVRGYDYMTKAKRIDGNQQQSTLEVNKLFDSLISRAFDGDLLGKSLQKVNKS